MSRGPCGGLLLPVLTLCAGPLSQPFEPLSSPGTLYYGVFLRFCGSSWATLDLVDGLYAVLVISADCGLVHLDRSSISLIQSKKLFG